VEEEVEQQGSPEEAQQAAEQAVQQMTVSHGPAADLPSRPILGVDQDLSGAALVRKVTSSNDSNNDSNNDSHVKNNSKCNNTNDPMHIDNSNTNNVDNNIRVENNSNNAAYVHTVVDRRSFPYAGLLERHQVHVVQVGCLPD